MRATFIQQTKRYVVTMATLGKPGLKGADFKYSDFTPEQLALLKGNPFLYSDFTPEQLLLLTGPKGDNTNSNDVSNLSGVVGANVTGALNNLVVKEAGKSLISSTEIARLLSITAIFTTALKIVYDSSVSWISTNGTNLINHLTRNDNPHSVTKTQVGLGNVDNTSDANKPISTATNTALNDKISGSGTALTIPLFSGSKVIGDSSMKQSPNGNLGINTTLPLALLEIKSPIFATTLFSGDGIVIKKNSWSGGWARPLVEFREFEDTLYSSFSVYGSNNSMIYSYIGTAFDQTWIRFLPTKHVSISRSLSINTAVDNGVDKLQVNGNIQTNALLKVGQFTDGTEPAYIKGAQYFNTTINKIKIGGATAWEIVTSS